jgi:predicted dehydrogenase
MSRIRVGVIGAGSWAVASHLPTLALDPDVEFVAVARKGPEQLARIKSKFGFEVASEDYRDVLSAGIDVCVVASPASVHHEHVTAALEAGAHVMCEKPFTIASAEAWELVTMADELDRQLIIAFGSNYLPMVKQARQLMTDVGIGTLEQISIVMSSTTRELMTNTGSYPDADQDAIPEQATWTDPLISGGGYGQAQLTHALGLGLWLTQARVQSAFAYLGSPMDAPVEMHDAVAFRCDGGAVGVLSGGSSHLGANGNKHALEVRAIGSDGQLQVDLEREIVYIFKDGKEYRADVSDGDGLIHCRGPIEALLSAARGDYSANESPGELGARTVEALEIAYRSARSGMPETRLL